MVWHLWSSWKVHQCRVVSYCTLKYLHCCSSKPDCLKSQDQLMNNWLSCMYMTWQICYKIHRMQVLYLWIGGWGFDSQDEWKYWYCSWKLGVWLMVRLKDSTWTMRNMIVISNWGFSCDANSKAVVSKIYHAGTFSVFHCMQIPNGLPVWL